MAASDFGFACPLRCDLNGGERVYLSRDNICLLLFAY